MNPPTIEIPIPIHREMQVHLERTYPNEGCGILVGADLGERVVITRFVPTENQNTERGHDRFEIDPRVYLETERRLAADEQIVGFVHSHPDCPETPSETDRTFALGWPGFVWLIYRVEQGTAASVRGWILDEEERFVECVLAFPHTRDHT